MINIADKFTAKTVEGIVADSNEIKYDDEMGTAAKEGTVANRLNNLFTRMETQEEMQENDEWMVV